MSVEVLAKLTPEQIAAYKAAGVLDKIIEQKNDILGSPNYTTPVYAPRPGQPTVGGIFTEPGIRPEVFSTVIQPLDFLAALRLKPSRIYNEKVSILTGQRATTGTNPADTCSAPVTPGDLKKCSQLYTFGKLWMGSPKIQMDEAGMILNRAVNPVVIQNMANVDPLLPDVLRQPNVNFESIEAQALYQLGTAMRRAFVKVAITGNPATAYSSTEAGFIKEFNGLDTVIKTGYTDAETGTACPAADSDVRTWNALTSASVSSRTIVQEMSDQYYGRKLIASQLGMEGVQWAYVMHEALFRELTYAWTINYFTSRGQGTAGNPNPVNGESIVNLQLDMLNNRYLLIDNEKVPVIFHDTPLVYLDGATAPTMEADIYLVALSWNGMDLVEFEHFDLTNPAVSALIGRLPGQVVPLNNGAYLMSTDRTGMCLQLAITGQFRMFHLAPFLCGRLDNVRFVSNIRYRSYDPGNTFSHVNGGVTFRTVSSTTGI